MMKPPARHCRPSRSFCAKRLRSHHQRLFCSGATNDWRPTNSRQTRPIACSFPSDFSSMSRPRVVCRKGRFCLGASKEHLKLVGRLVIDLSCFLPDGLSALCCRSSPHLAMSVSASAMREQLPLPRWGQQLDDCKGSRAARRRAEYPSQR